jgi:uncharacterized membrane protein YfcA
MEHLGFVASLAMGITLGLMGGGGSILTVPILVYLFALPPTIATSYSLFIVGTTALIGSLMYIRKGEIDFQAVVAFAIPSVAGVNVSRGIIIPQIPTVVFQFGDFTLTKEILVMVAFAVLMIAASYSMIKKRIDQRQVETHSIKRFVLMGLQGSLVGIVAGFVGAGGGFLIIPVLVFMAGLSMRIAVGTSLAIIAIQSLLGFMGDISRGINIDWSLLGTVAVFAAFGIAVGSAFAHRIQEHKLKTAFGWFVLFMGLAIFLEQVRHL